MTLWQQMLDRVILWRMEILNEGEIPESWLDPDTDMIVRDNLPPDTVGQYDRVRENAIPLVDGLLYVVQNRLR